MARTIVEVFDPVSDTQHAGRHPNEPEKQGAESQPQQQVKPSENQTGDRKAVPVNQAAGVANLAARSMTTNDSHHCAHERQNKPSQ